MDYTIWIYMVYYLTKLKLKEHPMPSFLLLFASPADGSPVSASPLNHRPPPVCLLDMAPADGSRDA